MDKDITQEQVVNILKNGGVGILATDTIYGLVGSALNKQTVSRILKIKERAPEKTFIVLINSLDELALFGVEMNKATNAIDKSSKIIQFDTKEDLIESLETKIEKNDVILVKGSRGMAMEKIIIELKNTL